MLCPFLLENLNLQTFKFIYSTSRYYAIQFFLLAPLLSCDASNLYIIRGQDARTTIILRFWFRDFQNIISPIV
jgi:hypothetical protein